ncbi:hypothetical protein [uncultured Clostridium sp.]|uniref:hypothetical protein n=1 Tax=uncultured Clostridium sp. TaxID=59620 RepID=UPI0028E3AB7A|nr:hypothetical protein [uncultured Clostridium sp.]
MKEIILGEIAILWGDGVGTYFIEFTIKGTGIQGRYTLKRSCEDGELTNADIVKMIQEEIYGKEYTKGKDITIKVNIDDEQFQKDLDRIRKEMYEVFGIPNELMKTFDALKQSKRVGVGE